MRLWLWAMVATGGCATMRNPDHWNIDNELGAFVAPAPTRFSRPPERVDHGTDVAERRAPVAPAAELPADVTGTTIGGVGRVGVTFIDHLIAGIEFEGGGVRSPATDAATTDSAVHLGMASVVGVTARYGRVSLGAELVAGLRKLERHSDDFEWFYVEEDGFVEARLRAHAWLTSWLALGAYVAFDRLRTACGGAARPGKAGPCDRDGTTGVGLRLIGRIPDSQRRHRRSK